MKSNSAAPSSVDCSYEDWKMRATGWYSGGSTDFGPYHFSSPMVKSYKLNLLNVLDINTSTCWTDLCSSPLVDRTELIKHDHNSPLCVVRPLLITAAKVSPGHCLCLCRLLRPQPLQEVERGQSSALTASTSQVVLDSSSANGAAAAAMSLKRR